jgi:hypothetical protein
MMNPEKCITERLLNDSPDLQNSKGQREKVLIGGNKLE